MRCRLSTKPLSGMSSSSLRSPRRSVRAKAHFSVWLILACGLFFGMCLCSRYFVFHLHYTKTPHIKQFSLDGLMLEILRGFQGVGAAASIPASVSTPLLRD